MPWTIELTARAIKQLTKIDKTDVRRIRNFLIERLAVADDPRSLGRALKGADFGDYWRYRVGDYRLVCELQDKRLLVIVVSVGHRSDIYR